MTSPILSSGPFPHSTGTEPGVSAPAKLKPPFANKEKENAFKALFPSLLNTIGDKPLPDPIKSSKYLGDRWVFKIQAPDGSTHYLKAFADKPLPKKVVALPKPEETDAPPENVNANFEKFVRQSAQHFSIFDMFPIVKNLKGRFNIEGAPPDQEFSCFIHEGVKGNLLWFEKNVENIPFLVVAKSLLASFILGMNDGHACNCIVSEDLTEIYFIDNINSLSPSNVINYSKNSYHSFFRTGLLSLIQTTQLLTPEQRAQIKQWIETSEKELEGYKRYLESPHVINKFKKRFVIGLDPGKIYQAMKERIEALKQAIDHEDSVTLRDFIFKACPSYKFFVGLQAVLDYHIKRQVPPEPPLPNPRDLKACIEYKEQREKALAQVAAFENHFRNATPLPEDDFVEWSTLALGRTGMDGFKQILDSLPPEISLSKIQELTDQTKTHSDYFLKLLDLARENQTNFSSENGKFAAELEEKVVINNADHTSLGADENIRNFLFVEALKYGVPYRNAFTDTLEEEEALKNIRSLCLTFINQDQPKPALSFYFKLLSREEKHIRLDYRSDPGKIKTLDSGGPFEKDRYYTMREAIQLFNTWGYTQALTTFQKCGYTNLSEHVKKADLMVSDDVVQATLPHIEAIPEGELAYFLEQKESKEHLYILFKTATGETYCFEMEHVPNSRIFKLANTPSNGWNTEVIKNQITYLVSQIILEKHFHHCRNEDKLPYIEKTQSGSIKVRYQFSTFELDVFSKPGLYRIRGSEGFHTAEQLREKIITESVEHKLQRSNILPYSASFKTPTGPYYAYKWKTVGTEKCLKIYVKTKNENQKLTLDCFSSPGKFQIKNSTDSSFEPGKSFEDNFLVPVLINLRKKKP